MITPKDLKQIINLFACTSKDEARPHIMGVSVKRIAVCTAGWMAEFCATDGAVLATYRVKDDELCDGLDKNGPILIPNSNVDYLRILYKEVRKWEKLPLDRLSPYFHCPVTSFPSYENVVPRSRAHTLEIALDLSCLKRLMESLKIEGRDKANGIMRLSIGGPLDAVLVENKVGDIGVLMPNKF